MNIRKQYTANESMLLFNEVGGICPSCSVPLSYKKKNIQKKFEIAHVYPLNIKSSEVDELAGVPKLSSDLNHLDNVICLCPNCHTKFDKPRTRSEYIELYNLKKNLLNVQIDRQQWHKYDLENKIEEVIKRISEDENLPSPTEDELDYDPTEIDNKLDSTISSLLIRKIKYNVSEYYPTVRAIFKERDFIQPLTTEIISTQIKLYYLKNKHIANQAILFKNVVEWLHNKSNFVSYEATEIIASYFVQNCELFAPDDLS